MKKHNTEYYRSSGVRISPGSAASIISEHHHMVFPEPMRWMSHGQSRVTKLPGQEQDRALVSVYLYILRTKHMFDARVPICL